MGHVSVSAQMFSVCVYMSGGPHLEHKTYVIKRNINYASEWTV